MHTHKSANAVQVGEGSTSQRMQLNHAHAQVGEGSTSQQMQHRLAESSDCSIIQLTEIQVDNSVTEIQVDKCIFKSVNAAQVGEGSTGQRKAASIA